MKLSYPQTNNSRPLYKRGKAKRKSKQQTKTTQEREGQRKKQTTNKEDLGYVPSEERIWATSSHERRFGQRLLMREDLGNVSS